MPAVRKTMQVSVGTFAVHIPEWAWFFECSDYVCIFSRKRPTDFHGAGNWVHVSHCSFILWHFNSIRSLAGLGTLQICTTITSVINGAVNTCLIPLYHTHTLEHGVVTVSTFGGHMQMVNLTRIVQMLLRLSTCVTESTRRLLDPVSSTVSVLLVQMLKSRVDWCRVSVWIAEMHSFIAVISGTYGVWRQIHATWRGSWAYMQQKSDQRRREMILKRDRNVVLSVLVDFLKFDHGIDFSLVVCF